MTFGGWGKKDGGWGIGGIMRSYMSYKLYNRLRRKTPGGKGGSGESRGRCTLGKLFGQLFLMALAVCLFKGIPLLLMPVAAAIAAGVLTLVIYGIVWLVSGDRKK
jgi:hypothetical protein